MVARRESSIEKSFNRMAAKRRFLSVKLYVEGLVGFPDRTVFGTKCHIFFVELKQKGKQPRASQIAWHNRLRKIGFNVYVCDSVKQAEEILDLEKGLQDAK